MLRKRLFTPLVALLATAGIAAAERLPQTVQKAPAAHSARVPVAPVTSAPRPTPIRVATDLAVRPLAADTPVVLVDSVDCEPLVPVLHRPSPVRKPVARARKPAATQAVTKAVVKKPAVTKPAVKKAAVKVPAHRPAVRHKRPVTKVAQVTPRAPRRCAVPRAMGPFEQYAGRLAAIELPHLPYFPVRGWPEVLAPDHRRLGAGAIFLAALGGGLAIASHDHHRGRSTPVLPPGNPVNPPEIPDNPPENPGNPPENPGSPPENPGNPPENPGNPPENPGTPPENPGNPPENPGNPPENPGNPPDNPNPPENPNPPDNPNPPGTITPEPVTTVLVAGGIAVLAAIRGRRQRKNRGD